MTAPLTGPTWYWLAGTIALVLCAWAAVSVAAAAAWCMWVRWCRNRENAERDIDQPIANTKPDLDEELRKLLP